MPSFLDLPPEIRVMIYKDVLVSPDLGGNPEGTHKQVLVKWHVISHLLDEMHRALLTKSQNIGVDPRILTCTLAFSQHANWSIMKQSLFSMA